VSEAEKRHIREMTEEERQAGLDGAVKGLVIDLLKIASGLVIMWIIWRAYF